MGAARVFLLMKRGVSRGGTSSCWCRRSDIVTIDEKWRLYSVHRRGGKNTHLIQVPASHNFCAQNSVVEVVTFIASVHDKSFRTNLGTGTLGRRLMRLNDGSGFYEGSATSVSSRTIHCLCVHGSLMGGVLYSTCLR